jgi:hypothetical protein
MSLPASPSFKAKLVSKHVIVKLSLFTRAFAGTVVATDETGFCFQSDDMVAALREVTGSIMAKVDGAPGLSNLRSPRMARILRAKGIGGFSIRNFRPRNFVPLRLRQMLQRTVPGAGLTSMSDNAC